MTAVPSDIIGTTMSSKLTDGNDDNARREKKRGKEQIGPFSTHSLFSPLPLPPFPIFVGPIPRQRAIINLPGEVDTHREEKEESSLSLSCVFLCPNRPIYYSSAFPFSRTQQEGAGPTYPSWLHLCSDNASFPGFVVMFAPMTVERETKVCDLYVHSANRCTNYVHSRRRR